MLKYNNDELKYHLEVLEKEEREKVLSTASKFWEN